MKTLRRLLPYIKPYRRRLAFAIGGMCFFTILSVLPPLLLRYLIDGIIKPNSWNLLPIGAALLIGVPIISAAIRFVNVQTLMRTSHRFIADMRVSMYNKVLHLSMRYHGNNASGSVVGRIMDDVNMLQQLISSNTVQILVDLIVFAFSLTVAFTISWKLWLLLCMLLTLYVFVYRYYSERIRVATQSYREVYDRITGRLQETLAGVRQVRIYNREDFETEVFLDKTEKSLSKSLASSMSSVGLSTACMSIAAYGSTLIMGMGAYFVLKGYMTFGDLVAFNSYVWMAIQPTVRLTTVAGQLAETFVSAERILEVLEAHPDIVSKPGAPPIAASRGAVAFRNVHFSYTDDKPLYQGLSLTVEPGQSIALVGPTGCGKTTLTALLMRYWDVHKGAVLIDNADIRSVDLKSLRSLFGVVLQQPVLFDGTFAENIAYGKPDASRQAIEEAARAAEIYDVAMELPKGFDTQIGTYGVKLSVGEKQRVSIARAILKDPLILIMDEATSALDSESEELIQRALARVLVNRTSFVVAHRLSTITGADKIVCMEQGKIVATGTHRELIAQDGSLYQKLHLEMIGQAQEATV